MKKTSKERPSSSSDGSESTGMLTLHSSAFEAGESIPDEYTCEGDDVSPALSWSGVPEGTESLALILNDPDAPGRTFTHWVLFNVPADGTQLPRDLDVETQFPGAEPPPKEGKNDFGTVGYGGPCPPENNGAHRYFFRLYALDSVLDLKRGIKENVLRVNMKDHVLAETELVGTFQR